MTDEIRRVVDAIWEVENPSTSGQRARGRPRQTRQRPRKSSELILQRAEEREIEMRMYSAREVWRASNRARRARQRGQAAPRQPRQSSTTLIEEWANLEWKRRWQKTARGKKATTWKTPWKKETLELYSDLPKHQATALFLLRTEVIGLNAWLASIRVPGIRPECGCGWRAQTVEHVLAMCPKYSNERAALAQTLGSEIKM